MAMPSGNVVTQDGKDKVPNNAGGGGAASEILHYNHNHSHGGHHYRPPPPQPWYVDERDGFISWLRGEFAAANAIIDSLCHHLRVIGEPGEYDVVLGCIQQRRCNWNSVLYMQQYFPVTEVMQALKQAAWRRQQPPPRHFDAVKSSGKEFRRSSSGFKPGQRTESAKEGHNSGVESSISDSGVAGVEKVDKGNEKCEESKNVANFIDMGRSSAEEQKAPVTNSVASVSSKNSGSTEMLAGDSKSEAEMASDGCTATSKEQNSNGKQGISTVPKTFVANELIDGRMVNVVDGLKLYEELWEDKEVRKLVSLANDLRAAGRRGQFQGQTYVASKRPTKGHGREMIQLGLPIADAPVEAEIGGIPRDKRIESIPALLQEVIDRVVGKQIMSVKPDSCVIDFYNEGDHSQPNSWPHWYGRPICILFLTECDMTFGRVITFNHPGDFKGPLKLALAPGSLLVMHGKSSDLAKHAIPSLRKQRILITFTKCQPKKPTAGETRLPSPTMAQPSHWGQPTQRSFNSVLHATSSKHFASAATTNVLPPTIHPQMPAPNGIQPILMAPPVVPALPFQAPVPIPAASAGWPASAPRHPPPHPPVPGTGVFLPPPGSGNPSSPKHSSAAATEINVNLETPENGSGKIDRSAITSSTKKSDNFTGRQEANGSVEDQRNMAKEESYEGSDKNLASKPIRAA